jgi:hypothetical protein
MSGDDFDWSSSNEDVIVPEQRATAVYVNPWGQAVIRQERAWNDEEDTSVVVDHAHLPDVIKALRVIADAPVMREERLQADVHPAQRQPAGELKTEGSP